jgi:hypothetical protein
MPRSRVLDEILRLDPVADHERIVFLSTRYDFPFDTTRSLEFALFRTFCVPSIGALLDRTGEFYQRAQKRYDDTDIIVSELMEHGYDSERGKRALRRMNLQHGRFAIRNEDFLYVLSTFIYEPIRWNARFGWRLMCVNEKLALFHFWRAVGRRMSIQDIPADFEEYERFNVAYEKANYRFTEANQRVGQATLEMFVAWFPRLFGPLTRRAMIALMDDPVVEGFGFPRPSRAMRWLMATALKLRARVLRLLPRRRRPVLRTEATHWSYPNGYEIEQLGPPVEDATRLER